MKFPEQGSKSFHVQPMKSLLIRVIHVRVTWNKNTGSRSLHPSSSVSCLQAWEGRLADTCRVAATRLLFEPEAVCWWKHFFKEAVGAFMERGKKPKQINNERSTVSLPGFICCLSCFQYSVS